MIFFVHKDSFALFWFEDQTWLSLSVTFVDCTTAKRDWFQTNKGRTDGELSTTCVRKIGKENLTEPGLEAETSGLLHQCTEVSGSSPGLVKFSSPIFFSNRDWFPVQLWMV